MIINLLKKIIKEKEGASDLINATLEFSSSELLFIYLYNHKNLLSKELEPFTDNGKKLLDFLNNFHKHFTATLDYLNSFISFLSLMMLTDNAIDVVDEKAEILDKLKMFYQHLDNELNFDELFTLRQYCYSLLKTKLSDSETLKKLVAHLDQLELMYIYNIIGKGLPTKTNCLLSPKASFEPRENNCIQHYINTSKDSIGSEGAWADLMKAIKDAEKCIFICGWQFEPQLYFPSYESSGSFSNNGKPKTLGEILIDKAVSSPEILIVIMPWMQSSLIKCDNHSNALTYLKQLYADKVSKFKGLIPENSTPLKDFKATNQNTVPVNFLPDAELPTNLLFREISADIGMSRHLKMALVDTVSNKKKRQISGFYGSADLAEGRFDWHNHVIGDKKPEYKKILANFKASKTYHSSQNEYPRRGWREIISRVEGPVVLDMLSEFISRYLAASSSVYSYKGSDTSFDTKLKIFFNKVNMDFFNFEEDKDNNLNDNKSLAFFNCQLLRSSPKSHHLPTFWGVNKNLENSIHKGYLHAIKQAENFIFIENQFLCMNLADVYSGLDSKKAMDLFYDKKLDLRQIIKNKIPLALVDKIIEKYRAKKPFHVFIVLPLLPEVGDLNDFAMWQIRAVQWLTMAWMIKTLEKETIQWQQYLSFYFYGQWHGYDPIEYKKFYDEPTTTRGKLATIAQRNDIYVHSKFMLIDDLLVINGSANINERSMRGDMDGEIALYQWPQKEYLKECKENLQIFRHDLWSFYMGSTCIKELMIEGFEQPHLPESLVIIRNAALANLNSFYNSTEGSSHSTGKMMLLPILGVDNEWKPILDPQFVHLPDTPKSIIEKYNTNGKKLSDLGPYALIPDPTHALSGLQATLATMSRTITGFSYLA